jgi:hypothetical protein
MEQPKTRPTGVTILGILGIISGALLLFAGLIFAGLAAISPGMDAGMFGGVVGALIGILGAVFIALGVAYFFVAWGLLKGKPWAWTVTLILTIIDIAVGVVSIIANPASIIGLIINGIILYYLFRPHVKAYFGKGSAVL